MPFVKQKAAHHFLQDPRSGPGEHGHGGGQVHINMPRADLVMVFPYKTDSLVRWGELAAEEELRGLRQPSEAERHKMQHWKVKFDTTVGALSDAGLILLPYFSRDRDEIFLKISANEQHLRQVAEMKKHKLELKAQYLSAFAEYKNDVPGRREIGYSDRCVVSHLFKAHTDETDLDNGLRYPKPDAIFRTVDRIQLIDYMVRSSDHNCAGVDVGQLMHDDDILHYFPLQENAKLKDLDKDWFKAFAWGSRIDKVRNYFGERIALYFLFLSNLNKWLFIPAVVGVILWIYDVFDYTPDNYSLVPLSIAVGVWSLLFVHSWRRAASTYSLRWGTLGMGKQLEPTRPEFRGVSRINPVTGRCDRYYPWTERIWKVMFSWGVLSVSIIVLIFGIMCLFWLRHTMHRHGGRLMFQCINAICVEVLGSLFTRVAKWLTERENHRAYTEYANHMLCKTVIFKFVNCYSSLYYIAFFKDSSYLFGTPMKCHSTGLLTGKPKNDCLNDLGSQLAIFMLTRLILQNFVELGVPYIVMWWRSFREGRTFNTSLFTNPLTVMPDLSQAEKQSKKEDFDLYEDMDEILVLFGYTTLFVVAAPWVPLLALVSNLLECFLDQKKLVLLYRRPMPLPAANNEPWDTAFEVFGMIAMMTNLAVAVFASSAFEHWSHAHRIFLFIGAEHILIGCRIIFSVLAPAVPYSVRLLQMQQQVVLHKHMDLGGEEDDTDTRDSAMRTSQTNAPHILDQDDEIDGF